MLTRTLWTPWETWREMEDLQSEVNRLFNRTRSHGSHRFPALNAWSDDERLIVTAELPGFEVENLDISVVNNHLTVKGERKARELGEGDKFHRRERKFGQFQRTIKLPFNVEVNKVEAKFNKGILNITLPKAEAEKPRKISVNVN